MMTEINGKSVSVKKSIEIYEAPNFRVFSVIEKSTDCLTSDVLLSTEPSEYAYEWSLNSQLGDGDEMSYALLAGTYMATVKGISSAGCIGIVNHPVLVKDESGIYIPNSFAPDGDGLNDIWKPIGLLDDHSHELSIFTVPGQELVYHSTEIIEWNGSLNGQDMPARKNYLYQLKVTDACGNTETKSGTITTIR
jgi:gliding motility-associated-like protein